MLALLAPGQGAQVPGFLAPWLELPSVASAVQRWSAVLNLDLADLGVHADADTIRDTANAQPLLVGAGLAAATQLPDHIGAFAGHSVGELTAAGLSGVLSPESALILVRERGRSMAKAAASAATGMTAVLGGDPQGVLEKLSELGLTAANVNGAGQVVAAGTLEQLAALAADPPAGARLRPLAVAGAFHTEHMAPATAALAEVAASLSVSNPHGSLLSDADGAVVRTGPEFVQRLIAQVAAPVRWDLVMKTLGEIGVTAVIELPPAGTLVGLVKRALPGVETLALRTPDDLEAAVELIEKHRGDIEFADTPSWRLIVAPLAGTFASIDLSLGATVPAGTVLGRVVSKREARDVVATDGGTLVEWLAEDGDPVSPGQPLVRLHPEVVS